MNKDTENMPEADIIFEKITDNYNLKLAKFEENTDVLFQKIFDELSDDEKNNFIKIKNNKRKVEWLGTRILLKNMLGKYLKIQYDDKGNPYINHEKYISITHSGNYIGIIISKHQAVGIDTEFISDRILRTAQKFIPEDILQRITEKNALEKIYLHWCCKETLYKIKGGGGYDFKKDFILEFFQIQEKGEIISSVTKNQTDRYNLSYQFINQENKKLLIVWHG